MTSFTKYQEFLVSITALLLFNTFVLYQAIIGKLNTFDIMLLYWFENIIILFYYSLRIIFCRDGLLEKLIALPMFVVSFCGFCIGHAFIIFMIYSFLSGVSALSPSIFI